MSGPHLGNNTTTDSHYSDTGKMGVSSLNIKKRNASPDSLCSLEGASGSQSTVVYDDLCTVSEECQSTPGVILNLTLCNGIDHYVEVTEDSLQANSHNLLNSGISERCDQQVNLNTASEQDVVQSRSLCNDSVDFSLQNPSEIVINSDHCTAAMVRSNSFTETSSLDPLHMLCTATMKLSSSPKPVLRRHSMIFSRSKKQVKIEANAQVIEIDRGTSECPEIESGHVAPTADSGTDRVLTGKSDFCDMYIDRLSMSNNCCAELPLFNVSQEVGRRSLSLGNWPLSADGLTVTCDPALVLQEVPVDCRQKDINVSEMSTSLPHAAELTSARCRSYEVRRVEKPRVRHLVDEDDDDSCGDEADDESTANEEDLSSECKDEREHKRKRRKSVEDEIEKVVSSSPDERFLKFDWEIGEGSFKTVYKGLDSETGVHVAWCELQVCKSYFVTNVTVIT